MYFIYFAQKYLTISNKMLIFLSKMVFGGNYINYLFFGDSVLNRNSTATTLNSKYLQRYT